MKKPLLTIAFLTSVFSTFAISNNAVAETKKEIKKENAVRLDTVTVVATRTERDVLDVPAMVSVVDASEIGRNTSTKVSDLLAGTAGVEFVGGPLRSGETPNMRGFDSNSVIITLDGRRQNFESQHDGRFYIDPALLKKVEVVKGSSSALYGSGGLAGVIAFETKDAKEFLKAGRTTGAQTSVGYSTANKEINTTLSGFRVGEKSDQVASLVYRTTGDLKLNNGTKQRSDDNVYAGYGKVTYNINDESKVKVDVNSFYNFAKENTNPQAGFVQTSGKNLVKKDIHSNQAGINYSYNPESELVDLSTKIYYVDTNVIEDIKEGTTLNPVGTELEREIQTVGFNLDNKSKVNLTGLKEQTFSYGVEFYQNEQTGKQSAGTTGLGTGLRPGVANATATVMGGYLQDEIIVPLAGEMELFLTPAIRYDYYKNDPEANVAEDSESQFSPKFASTLKLNKNYNIFGSYSEGFRAPNLTELYAQGTHFLVGSNANSFVANPNLKPETSKTFEFGSSAKFNDLFEANDELRAKASRYITDSSDYIEQVITSGNIGAPGVCPFPFTAGTCNAGTTSFVNVAEANIWGYEAEVNYLNSNWDFALGASYVAAENAITGQALTTKQPLIFSSRLAYTFEDLGLTIGHKGKYADDNKKGLVDNVNQINYKRPGFATHGIFASYTPPKMQDFTFDLGVDNLFDKKYRQPFSEIYDLERNYQARVTYRW